MGAGESKPSYRFERRAMKAGARVVAGIDEAGRGPLAGPVVAAAVILQHKRIPKGIDDSKVLIPERRAELYDAIMGAAQVGVGVADVTCIDTINIFHAAMKAMADALSALGTVPCIALIDGNHAPSIACASETIVDGDAKCLSIAAASIIAKVTRDRMMIALDAEFPGYGFARHKGYSTPEHYEALARLGPCVHHRRSFAPVRCQVSGIKKRPR